MAKRFKPSTTIISINSLPEADSVLSNIAVIKRNLMAIEIAMNEKISQVKTVAEESAIPLRQMLFDLETALARYAEHNKAELFTDKSRSKHLVFGSLGYRSSSNLDTLGKTSWKDVLSILENSRLDDYIRMVPEVDKERLKKAPADIIKQARCVIRDKDEFYYELDETALSERQTA